MRDYGISLWQRFKYAVRSRSLKEHLHVFRTDVQNLRTQCDAICEAYHAAEKERAAMKKIIVRLCDVLKIEPEQVQK